MSQTATSVLQPIPYLNFDGNAEEAMNFYAKTLGGEVVSVARFEDMPTPEPMPDEIKKRVMNMQVRLPGGPMLYAGDTPPHMEFKGRHGFGIALNFNSVEEAKTAFGALAEGGSIGMEFAPTFWAEGFGMCDDKYGTSWLINANLKG